MLANGAGALLAAEKFVEEVVKWRLIVGLVRTSSASTAAMRILDGGFGIDIDHCRFQLFRDLRKLIGENLRRRYDQRRGVGTFLLLAFDSLRDDGADENTDRQCGQNCERVSCP